MDFKKEENVLAEDSASIASYVNGSPTWFSYLRHWNAPYYLRQSESNKLRFTDPANYEYLGFDACGGATLVVPADRIDHGRFNAGPPKSELMDEERYLAFTDFAKNMRAMNIDLVVLESAYRDGLRTKENDAQQAQHVERLRAFRKSRKQGVHRVVFGTVVAPEGADQAYKVGSLFFTNSYFLSFGVLRGTHLILTQ